MRIAIVGNFGLTGKQTMAVRALPLSQELAARGHQVLLALPIRRDSDRGGPAESGGVRIVYAGRGLGIPGLAHFWQAVVLAWSCWRWRPSTVYCFKPIAFSGAVLAAFWLLRGIGVFRGIIALDTDDWEGEGGWNEVQPFPGWLKCFVSRQEKWSLAHADVTTAASRALVELAEQAGARNVTYVPNAIVHPSRDGPSDETALSTPISSLEGRPVVLLYTRFVEFDPARLLDCFERLLRFEKEAVLLVVGQGLEAEEKSLGVLASQRGIADRVVLEGWVPPERLQGYFRLAQVALYPLDDTLLNRAKCPMKLLDLMAAGVAVVADRVGQAVEYLVDGRSGLLVSPGDPDAMAEAAASLLADPARRAAMGQAAAHEAHALWSWKVWAPEVERALLAQVPGN